MADPSPPNTTRPRQRKRRRPTPGLGVSPSGPRRVAVYLRRSTDDEHQPFSIGAQDTALAARHAPQTEKPRTLTWVRGQSYVLRDHTVGPVGLEPTLAGS